MAVMTALEVLELLQDPDFDTTAVFEEPAHQYFETSDMSVVEGTVTNHTVYISPPIRQSHYANGTVVEENDSVIYFSPSGLTFTPFKDQIVVIDSKDWVITVLNNYEGGEGNISLYEAGIRR